MSRKTISVVIPSFNEERSVDEMVDRLEAVFHGELAAYDYEIIFVDDFSTDGTRATVRRLAKQNPRVKGVFNARNFGFHRNIFSALTYGNGDATFMLFGDLQDPPEMLPEFVRRWEEGDKVVVGQRRSSDEGWFMTILRRMYYTTIRWFSDTTQIARFTGYGLYDREFVEILKRIDDVQPFFKAVVAEYGLDIAIVQYDQAKSARGKSNFNFLKNYDFAMQGLTASTKLMMRFATFLAGIVGIVCLGVALFVLINKLVDWERYSAGEASVTVGIFLLGAVQLFFIGVLGEYILSINGRLTSKPRVVVGEWVNLAPAGTASATPPSPHAAIVQPEPAAPAAEPPAAAGPTASPAQQRDESAG